MKQLIACVLVCIATLARAQSAGGFEDLNQLLDALETADQSIQKLSARILYEREYALAGDMQIRDGQVSFVVAEQAGGRKSRAFAVVFETTIVGERTEPDGRTFVFDGRWLTERIPGEQLLLRREVAPPGADFDPLRIGQGPLPLPLGQKKADILANYEAELRVAEDGLEGRDDLVTFTRGCAQLMLIPNQARAARDDFEKIRLWYKRDEAGLLPRMAMTLNKTGDEVVVRLWQVKLNDDAEIDEGDFDTRKPEGWDLDEESYRGASAGGTLGVSPVLARIVAQPEMFAGQ